MKYFNLLDNKVFISLANTANGDVNSATRFYYCQKRLGDYCQGWGESGTNQQDAGKILSDFESVINLSSM